MPILGAWGWECGNRMLNAVDISNDVSVSSVTAHTGTYSLRFYVYNPAAALWELDGSPANPSMSAWLYLASSYDNTSVRIHWILDSWLRIELRWNPTTHTFDAYVNGALVKAGTVTVANNTWFHVQFYVVIADAGHIGVKIDGHQSIDWPCDTKPGAEAGVTHLYILATDVTGQNLFVDDLVLGYAEYLGACEVYDKLVASDSVVAWTPSTGIVNYAMEDEVPPSDTDFNQTAITATVDKLGLAALDLTDKVVEAVIPWSRAADPDAHGSSIKVGIESGGVASTATRALAAAYQYYWGAVDEVNPNGGAAWGQASVDALLHTKESVIP